MVTRVVSISVALAMFCTVPCTVGEHQAATALKETLGQVGSSEFCSTADDQRIAAAVEIALQENPESAWRQIRIILEDGDASETIRSCVAREALKTDNPAVADAALTAASDWLRRYDAYGDVNFAPVALIEPIMLRAEKSETWRQALLARQDAVDFLIRITAGPSAPRAAGAARRLLTDSRLGPAVCSAAAADLLLRMNNSGLLKEFAGVLLEEDIARLREALRRYSVDPVAPVPLAAAAMLGHLGDVESEAILTSVLEDRVDLSDRFRELIEWRRQMIRLQRSPENLLRFIEFDAGITERPGGAGWALERAPEIGLTQAQIAEAFLSAIGRCDGSRRQVEYAAMNSVTAVRLGYIATEDLPRAIRKATERYLQTLPQVQ